MIRFDTVLIFETVMRLETKLRFESGLKFETELIEDAIRFEPILILDLLTPPESSWTSFDSS